MSRDAGAARQASPARTGVTPAALLAITVILVLLLWAPPAPLAVPAARRAQA